MDNMTIDPKAVSDPVALRREMRRALATISGKWKLEILWLLNRRVHRFGELKRAIPGITQHMLTAQLRELEADLRWPDWQEGRVRPRGWHEHLSRKFQFSLGFDEFCRIWCSVLDPETILPDLLFERLATRC